jgi:hypothetical protein
MCSYFIPTVIGRQAWWLTGKIRMRLTASGAPVAMKRRAVEPVNKVKILPVQDDINIPNTGFSFKKKSLCIVC